LSPPQTLVRIEIEGTPFEVPDGDVVLSAIQYIVRELVPVLGRFCWSDECGNCEMTLARRGERGEERIRGCQTRVEDGMSLSDLRPDLRYWLSPKLR
jgi:hypothetical protein